MSYITNVTIYTDYDAKQLTATEPAGMGVRQRREGNRLIDVGSQHSGPIESMYNSGGSKFFTAGVLLGAYNYLNVDEFTEWVRDKVEIGPVILICDTEGDIVVSRIGNGNITEIYRGDV